MMTLVNSRLRRFAASAGQAAILLTLVSSAAWAQVNAGDLTPQTDLPFTMTQVATFNLPWRIAFLPDGRMLITEKVGPVWLVTQQGEKTQVANVPAVLARGRAACWACSSRRITPPITTSISRIPSLVTSPAPRASRSRARD